MMISSEPKCAAMSSMTDTIALGSATSSVHAFALPPDAVMASATALVPSAVMSTLAPSSAKACAVVRPMPLAAPVTSTVKPLTERESFLKSGMEFSRAEYDAGADRQGLIDKACTDPGDRSNRNRRARQRGG